MPKKPTKTTKTAKRPMGRRSKLTPEVQERVVAAIRAGNYAQVAAGYAGIGETTYYRWMQLGREAASGRYRDFWEAVKSAERAAEVEAVAMVRKQMHGNWTAAMTFLERKYPDRWGRRSRMDVTSGGERVGGVLVVPAPSSAEAWGAAVLELKQQQELKKAEHWARLQLESGTDGD